MNKTSLRGLAIAVYLIAHVAGAQARPEARASTTSESTLEPSLFIEPNVDSLRKGWPLVLTLHLMHPGRVEPSEQLKKSQSLIIEAPAGWDQLLSIVVVRRESGRRESVDWPLRRIESPPRRVVLNPSSGQVIVHYVLSPTETAKLASGNYHIVAQLDTTRGTSVDSWKGTTIETIGLVVSEQPTDATSAKTCHHALVTHQYLLVVGQTRDAVAALDDFLSKDSEGASSACMAKRAEVAEQEGNFQMARDYYCKAEKAHHEEIAATLRAAASGKQAPDITTPSYGQDCRRIARQLAKGDAGTAGP